VRIEMRCIARPNPERLIDPFREETRVWMTQFHLTRADEAPLISGNTSSTDPRLDHEDVAAIPALFARLPNETDDKRANAISQHLNAALAKANAPAAARALAVYDKPRESLLALAAPVASMQTSDPHAAATAWLTLEYAIGLESKGRFKEARPLLERVLAFPMETLGERDPVRLVATLHLASLQRRAGDAAGADASVTAAGLTRAQCMLFDIRPVVTDPGIHGRAFPEDALVWGFDGFVRESFDIAADGSTENVRTIIAYPPFVFRSAAERKASQMRYIAPVVEGGAAGCESMGFRIRYTIHHND
jgi:hypothetical protein